MPLLLVLLLSCGNSDSDTATGARLPRPIEARFDPAPTVVVIVVDTLTRRHLGPWEEEGWDTTPRLDAFFQESTLLADTQVARGLTGVSVSSITTGTWPRVHGVRDNRDWALPWNRMLPELFQAKGYTTLGYAANTCNFIDRGIDERHCTWNWEVPDGFASQVDRDIALVDDLVADLEATPAEEPLFVWLHLIDPHDPFNPVERWYDEFHPEEYTGELNPEDAGQLDEWILQGRELTEEEQRHLNAVYASQVRETDNQLGRVLDALQASGRYDEAVILFTADHGEELGEHHGYFFHGCSAYQQTMQVASAIRAPGRLPEGLRIDTTIRSVDLAPTLADVAGIGWEDFRDGESLVDELVEGAVTERPAFFERSLSTAGVVYAGHRYILDVNEGFAECKPYDVGGGAFPSEREELYDHSLDPDEQNDIADADPETLAMMRELTCTWVTEDTWLSTKGDATHTLVSACREYLPAQDEDPAKGCASVSAAASTAGALLGTLLLASRRRVQRRISLPIPKS